jgi:Carboxypeptidase regulatory-like domain
MKNNILIIMFIFAIQVSFAQTTTASIKGSVKNIKNESLPGANLIAIHLPTNSKYTDFANFDGTFRIINMKIGGPYKVTVSFVGYQDQVIEDLYLELGKATSLEVILSENNSVLNEVVVKSAGSKVFQGSRTGAETTIGRKELTTLPSISRSAEDFTRLEPSASGGSFGGRNDQYNNYSLNGAVFNNPFGLDAATPGGQTSAQPISLDAIDQIQVATAPYDVTLSGFTGASVNAVTKSGTNKITGTVYGFFRNENLTGNKIKGEKIFVPSLSQTQGGLSLGLPIIKDKLFVFGNFEFDNRTDLGANFAPNNADGITGINESRVLETDLIAVSNALKGLGYDTGDYQGFKYKSNSRKGIVKLDWNINDNHKLAFIYNFLTASKEKPANPTALGFRGPSASILQFQNSSYQINNNLKSFLLELNSKFGQSVSNKLQIGYTVFDDFRNPFSKPAPVINIQDGSGSNYIIAGHEPFSINNTLNQRVFQVTNNLNYVIGKHELTIGGSFEKFEFRNSFNLGGAGYDNFGNPNGYAGTFFSPYFTVGAFLADAAKPFATSLIKQNLLYAQTQFDQRNNFEVGKKGGWRLARLNVGQLAFYVQDEIDVNENFKLTLGLRADKPLYFNTADKITSYINNSGTTRNESIDYFNPQTGTTQKLISTQLPSNQLLWSPRIGFNWDTFGNKTLQVRGGTGIFTGKLPFVWLGNQISGADDTFLQIMDPNFKWPQVWRTSLGLDRKFESDYLLSLDFAYTKELNGVHVQNWGLKTPTGVLAGPGSRLIYKATDKLSNSAFVMTNSDAGSSFNATIKLQKTYKNGLFVSAAYNFLVAQNVNSIEAEITGDAFRFNPAINNVNDAVISNSKYGDKHRFIAILSKKFKYGSDNKWATTLTTFGEYAQGNRFSYTYGGDINNDGSDVNDLIYIPTTAEISSMTFASAGQGAAFDAFINQDDYLSSRRGKYAERYAALSPWIAKWDIKIIQDYNFKVSSNSKTKNTIQLSLDILNFGNLLNSDWGLVQVPTNVQPIGVSVTGGIPTYAFTGTQTKTFNYDSSLASRWQAQFGIRYIF